MGQPRRAPPWVFANLAEGAPTGVKALPVKAIAPGASVPISKWDGRQGYDRYEYLRKKREALTAWRRWSNGLSIRRKAATWCPSRYGAEIRVSLLAVLSLDEFCGMLQQ